MAVREEALSALQVEREGNPVLLNLSREEGDPEAVLELEYGRTVKTVTALLYLAGLDFGRVYEFSRNILTFGACDVGVFNGLDYCTEFSLARVAEAFTLRSGVYYNHILLCDELLGNLVEYGSIDLAEKLLGQLVLHCRVHKRLVVEEVVNHCHNEFSVLAGIS